MNRLRFWLRISAPLTALILSTLAGCGSKEGDLKTMSVDETTKIVESYAASTVEMIGDTRLDNSGSGKAPCEGRGGELADDEGPYFVQGTYNVPLPQDKHLQTLERLRDQWKSQGYEVTNFRKFDDNGAEIDV